MPTYQYRCTECGQDLEAVQKFTDATLTECPNCGGPLRKVFNAVGVVFKGSGFYRTDSRKADGAGDGASQSKDGASSGKGDTADSGSGTTTEKSTTKTDASPVKESSTAKPNAPAASSSPSTASSSTGSGSSS